MIRFVAFVFGLSLGCDSRPNPVMTPKPTSSYTYEVRHWNGMSQGKAPEFTVTGKHSVSVKDGRLKINGRDLGELSDGDSILVDEAGRVMINGSERKAASK